MKIESFHCRLRFVLGIFLLAFFFHLIAVKADHLPESLLANGKPETKLAAINLKSTKLNDVIQLNGPPTRQKKVPNNPSWTGYVWELPGAKLELDVVGGPVGTQIHGIYIEGNANGQVDSTGRGLKLGDDINAIRRTYGNIFEIEKVKDDFSKTRMEFTGVTAAGQYVTIQWKLEDFTLRVGLEKNGTISAMWLILPECYPHGCD